LFWYDHFPVCILAHLISGSLISLTDTVVERDTNNSTVEVSLTTTSENDTLPLETSEVYLLSPTLSTTLLIAAAASAPLIPAA
jgi:hypothetical protein